MEPMNAVTPGELDAKLQAIEARMDGRIATLTERMDGYMARMEERDKRSDDRFANFNTALADVSSDIKDAKSAVGSLKTTIVVTAVSSVLAIVLGVAAFNATVLSNMVASFDSGRDTAKEISEAAQNLKETQDLLKEIRAAQQGASAPR